MTQDHRSFWQKLHRKDQFLFKPVSLRRGNSDSVKITKATPQKSPGVESASIKAKLKLNLKKTQDSSDEDVKQNVHRSFARSFYALDSNQCRDDAGFTDCHETAAVNPLYEAALNVPYPLSRKMDYKWNLARVELPEEKSFRQGWRRRSSKSFALQPLMPISVFTGSNAVYREPCEQISTEFSRESDSIEAKGAQYLKGRGRLKRHTLPSNVADVSLNNAYVACPRRNSNSFGQWSQLGSSKRFFSPYPTSVSHGVVGGDNLAINMASLHRLEQLYTKALKIPQVVETVPLLSTECEFPSLLIEGKVSVEKQLKHTNLLGVGDADVLQRKSPSTQSLHTVSETEADTLGTAEMVTEPDSKPEVHADFTFKSPPIIDLNVSIWCSTYEQQASTSGMHFSTPIGKQSFDVANKLDKNFQLCFGQYYAHIPETSLPVSCSPYFVYGSMNHLVEKLKAALDHMGVGYEKHSGPLSDDSHPLYRVHHISLQNNENVCLNVGFSPSAISNFGVNVDFSYVEGYYRSYEALCWQLLNELKLQEMEAKDAVVYSEKQKLRRTARSLVHQWEMVVCQYLNERTRRPDHSPPERLNQEPEGPRLEEERSKFRTTASLIRR
ncbi:unnamed protein product [Soboliphyme baturini]|uniref:DNA polymerase theta n=1 Tax=Soboliphyme baturini TaxID=241478 RepID=A0A183IKW8_9BILA|nr:unnamed protein product [Soboliphyme baturini]